MAGIDLVKFRVEVFFSSYYRVGMWGIGIGLVGVAHEATVP